MKKPPKKVVAASDSFLRPEKRSTSVHKRERALEVVRAAYLIIAEKGFEGLRTREVAERVGINSATLHYHFPTKEALIQGVAEYLMEELKTSRAGIDHARSAMDRLQAEFTDIRARLKESPEQLIVLTELAVRARRDPAVARPLHYLDEGWRAHLAAILQQGVAANDFRPNLEVMATANTIMNQLRGLGYQGKLDPAALDKMVVDLWLQTEHWVKKVL